MADESNFTDSPYKNGKGRDRGGCQISESTFAVNGINGDMIGIDCESLRLEHSSSIRHMFASSATCLPQQTCGGCSSNFFLLELMSIAVQHFFIA